MPTETTTFEFKQTGLDRIVADVNRLARATKSVNMVFGSSGGGTAGGSIQSKVQRLRQMVQVQRDAVAGTKNIVRALQAVDAPFGALFRRMDLLREKVGRVFNPMLAATVNVRRALAGISRAFLGVGRVGVRSLGFVRRAFRTLGTAIRRAFQNLVSFRGLFLVFIAANAVRGVAEYADSWLNAANRIRAVSNNLADVGRIQEELFQIAQRTRTPLESVVELYSRLALGVGGEFRTDQLNQIVETVSQLAIIGGGTPQSIQGALIQLSQILGAGGAARGIGQELRSIREQTPALFQGIAKGLGLTTGELEKLAEQGKITAEGVAQSLLNVADEAAERFRNINLTIGQGVTRLSNAATKFFGIVGERTGAVTAIVNLLSDAAERLEQSAVAIGDTIRRSVQVARVALLGTSSGASQEQVDAAVVAYAGILGEIDNLARQFASAFGRLFLNLMEIGGRLLGTTFVAVFDTSIKQSIADVFRNVPGFAKVADAIAPDRTTIQTRILDIAPEERSLEQRLQRLQGSLGSASDTIVSRKFGGGASPADILRAQIASTKNQIKALQDERFELEQVLDQVPTQQERTDAAIARSQQDLADATNRFVNTFAEFKTDAKLAFDNIEATATEGAKAIGAEVGNAAVRVEDLLAPYRRILSRAKMGLGPEAEFRMVPQFTRSKSVFDDFGGGQPQEQRLSAIKAATNQYERLGKEINIVSTETQILRLTEDKSQQAKEDLVASLQQQVELLKEQKTVAERLAAFEENSLDAKQRVAEVTLKIAQAERAVLEARRGAGFDDRTFRQAFGESLREQVVQFDQLGELGDAAGSRIATAFGDGVTGALRDAITGAKNLEDAFRELASSLLLDLGQMIAKMAIFNAISGGFGSSAGGGSFFGLNLFSGLNPIPSANGNAFYGGQLMAFANGGIVNRPTVFPMANGAGIMGEAGPEAVLPLDRDSEGKLGVRSQGGGVQVLPVVFLDDRSQMEKLTDSEAFQDGLNRARRRRGDR